MATTATTPNELYEAIDSTLRNQTVPNSITPTTHSDLLYNLIQVLSGATSTTGATLVGETIYFDRVDSLSAFTVNLSTIDSSSLPLSGGNVTGGLTANTFNIQTISTGTSINSLGIDSSGNIINGDVYKSYVANLVQSSNNAPTITLLFNNLGVTVTSQYDSSGSYSLSASSDVFIANKTFVMINQTSADIVSAQKDPNSLDTILLNSSLGDDILNASIEIRVYN